MTRSEIIKVDYRVLSEAAETLFNISDVESLYQMFSKCKSWDEVNEAAADWLELVTKEED